MEGLKETGGPWGEGSGFVPVSSPASYNSWPANNGQCLSKPFRIRQQLQHETVYRPSCYEISGYCNDGCYSNEGYGYGRHGASAERGPEVFESYGRVFNADQEDGHLPGVENGFGFGQRDGSEAAWQDWDWPLF